MLIQQTMNHQNWMKNKGTARQFHIYNSYKNKEVPFWNRGKEKLFIESNHVERAILDMHTMTNLLEKNIKTKLKNFNNKIIIVPFEEFVLHPTKFILKIGKFLSSNKTNKTSGVMKEQNVPRMKVSDGIPLDIFKRCGWRPPINNLSEIDELKIRRDFAIKNKVRNKYLSMLDELSYNYETKYIYTNNLKNFI